ncbi:hypothetical protein QR685DRAFT_574319 [Neurospora intermedia]|uniref:DUF7587 domain-containing protein n=1 Tax=Neurospora intermedia TaxID=5142 RepID=A0ABR3D4C8_NEUIN
MAQSTNNLNVLIPERPRYLYFVLHASSRARPSACGGFYAADTWTIPQNPAHLQQLILNHANWACRVPSCFISTIGTCNFDHAWNWAMQRDAPVSVFEINTWCIHPQQMILKGCDFTPNCFDSEYLLLHTINGYAIRRRFLAKNVPRPITVVGK